MIGLAILALVTSMVLCACQSTSDPYYDQYDCVVNCDGMGGAEHHGGGL
jgi:hypothetical protein